MLVKVQYQAQTSTNAFATNDEQQKKKNYQRTLS